MEQNCRLDSSSLEHKTNKSSAYPCGNLGQNSWNKTILPEKPSILPQLMVGEKRKKGAKKAQFVLLTIKKAQNQYKAKKRLCNSKK
jgi:hypothetical protein